MEKKNAGAPVEVTAALIFREGRFMICQRPRNKKRGLLWEFPGGKVELGETRQEALIREFREELGATLTVGPLYMELVHEYPDITVHLSLYEARVSRGRVQLLEHEALRYITPEEIPQFAFCPADEKILEKLRQGR